MQVCNLLALHPNVNTDAELVAAWLGGRPPTTQRTYYRNAMEFMARILTPLREITPDNLQRYGDSLAGMPATQATKMNTVKSLFSFGFRIGYLSSNPGAAVVVGSARAEPALGLSLDDVRRLIGAASEGRDRTASRLSRADIGSDEVAVTGKLGMRRVVPIPPEAGWRRRGRADHRHRGG